MSMWINLNRHDLGIKMKALTLHPSESDPWTNDERILGLRLFHKPGLKIYAEDFDSSNVGIGETVGEAIASLRSKFPQI